MSRYSPFRIGTSLLVIASIWIGIAFSDNEKMSYSKKLDAKDILSLDLHLTDSGLGFYTVTIPDYSQQILFVQILDPHGNIIADKKIATKMAINYFKFSQSGKYMMDITNLSEKPVEFQVQIGNTQVSELIVPVVIAFVGAAVIAFSGYKRLSQRTAQPEENIS